MENKITHLIHYVNRTDPCVSEQEISEMNQQLMEKELSINREKERKRERKKEKEKKRERGRERAWRKRARKTKPHFSAFTTFKMRQSISIRGCVRPSVRP